MKAMILSDFIVAKKTLLQLLAICIFVSACIAFGTSNIITAPAAFTAMMVMMYMFTSEGLDELSGWQTFRLTLPISRKQVVLGRYGSIALVGICSTLVAIIEAVIVLAIANALNISVLDQSSFEGSEAYIIACWSALTALVIMLSVVALSLPVIMRFGLTKGSRFLPILIVIVLMAIILLSEEFGPGADALFEPILASMGPGPICLIGIAIMAILYAISAGISVRLYSRREL